MIPETHELPNDVATLQQMVKELQTEKYQREVLQYQQIAELERLYQQVTGQPKNPQWSLRDYALGIYHYLDNIIALAPGHIFWLDRNNVYLGCNNRQAKSIGLASRYDIVGKTNADLYVNLQADTLNKANSEVMHTGKPLVLEEASDILQGYRIFLSEKVPLWGKEGEIIGILGTALDITEQRNTIAALEKTKSSTQTDGPGEINDRKEKAEQYKLEEKCRQLQNALERSLEENQRLHAIQKRETIEFSAVYQQVTGQTTQPRFTLRDYALAIYEYLDNIIALAPGHIFWLDYNNVYLGCNNAQAKSVGLSSRQAIIGKTNADLTMAAQSDILNQANLEVMQTGKSLVLEEPADTLEGHRIFLSRKVPLRNKLGEIIGVLGTAIDITEQKQAMQSLEIAKKKAEEASWAKSEFIQNMSHDLKTPLTTIMGMAELLIYRETEADRKERLMVIHRAGKRVVDIFSNILEAASIEFGESNIQQQEISVHDIFQGLQELYQPLADEKQLTLILQVADTVPEVIVSDNMRIQRILLNLLGNALKFTRQGWVKAEATIEFIESREHLVLRVSDTGIGMPKDKLGLIFEKFVRLTPAYVGTYTGTGLGLGIVKRFVEELGGTVQVVSEEDKGTTFTCYLPVA